MVIFLRLNALASITFVCTWESWRNKSTVSALTNQIMTPESGIMDRQHQMKVYRLPRLFLSRSHAWLISLIDFLFTPLHLGDCWQGMFKRPTICQLIPASLERNTSALILRLTP